jgi:GNAT superfamily N-acetyltransferase
MKRERRKSTQEEEVVPIRNSWDVQPGTEEEMKVIDKKLCELIDQQVPFTQALDGNHEPVLVKNYVIKDGGKIIAGIKSDVYGWKILYIELLFVEEAHRHKALGSFLLNKVEAEARAMGARLAHLDTFDFQAKDFYLKHGYEVYGALEDCPPGHKRYHLKKVL